MTSAKPMCRARSFWLRQLLCVAMYALILCQLLAGSVCLAEDTADPYDMLYDVIMVRKGPDGKAYGKNEVGPFIYDRSEFPFDSKTFPQLVTAACGCCCEIQAESHRVSPPMAAKRGVTDRSTCRAECSATNGSSFVG